MASISNRLKNRPTFDGRRVSGSARRAAGGCTLFALAGSDWGWVGVVVMFPS